MSERIRKGAKNETPYDYEHSNPMSHEEAVEMNAVELYALKDLTAEQEIRFEEHYFECHECAAAVAVEQALIANARAAESAEKKTAWWRRLAFPVLTPVCAGLLCLTGFQSYQLALVRGPQANTVIVAKDDMGKAENGREIDTPSVTIERYLPPEAAIYPRYSVIISRDGKEILSKIVPAPGDSKLLSLQVQSRILSPGSYNVLVYGLTTQDSKDGPQIGRQYHFNVK